MRVYGLVNVSVKGYNGVIMFSWSIEDTYDDLDHWACGAGVYAVCMQASVPRVDGYGYCPSHAVLGLVVL